MPTALLAEAPYASSSACRNVRALCQRSHQSPPWSGRKKVRLHSKAKHHQADESGDYVEGFHFHSGSP